MKKIENSLWLSWEKHRRSKNLADKLGIPLYDFQSSAPRILKQPIFLVKSLLLLLRKRPAYLFVQNPSVILTLWSIVLRSFLKFKLIVDAHNAGIYPFEKGHEKYSILFPFMHRKADLTIVTNRVLGNIVEKNGGKPAILPDPLPVFPVVPERIKNSDKFIVTYVCSYSNDEPYLEVFKSATFLPDFVKIHVTGNDDKLTNEERQLAIRNGVLFTGYLSDEEYLSQLLSSDCILVLTTYEDCMVCGAYEAVALGMPLILSDNYVLKNWFGEIATYTMNSSHEIAASISKIIAYTNQCEFGLHFAELRLAIEARWCLLFDKVKRLIYR